MKIAFVFDDSLDQHDGVQQYMLSLQAWLIHQGHEVHFIVGQTKRTDIPNVHSLSRNVAVSFNGNKMTIPLWARRSALRTLFNNHTFDVLHVQAPYHPLMAGRVVAAALKSTAVIGTFHIAPFSRLATLATYALGLVCKPTLKQFDQMLSVSPAAAAFASKTHRLESLIIPNVFDYSRFATAKPSTRSKQLHIVFLGRLVQRKGCMTLLQALVVLRGLGYDLQMLTVTICGSGQLRDQLERYVNDHDLQDHVRFAGRISETEKPAMLASADISVFPSTAGESFGIVLLEAMACGNAAVLAGNNPGYASVMADKPELLFDPSNPLALADKLRWLLDDKVARVALAKWGRTHAKAYDVTVVGKKLVQQYTSIVELKKGTK